MSYDNILLARDGRVATVTVDRPEKLNALNKRLVADLTRCFAELGADPAVGAVVLTGSGEKAFVAGADIGELAVLNAVQAERVALSGQAMVQTIEDLGKPVIAAVNGFALGGGCELAMGCTFRYAADTARLGLPETGLGLIPGYGGTQRMARLVGRGRALELVLSGDMIDAETALRIGLVDRVFPAGELVAGAQAMAARLAEKSPLALSAALRAVNGGLELGQADGCRLEAAVFGVLVASDDAREGCQAFVEKRKPVFRGE
jgi:enoyl-CoA hydratase